jgi:hypothetical protein
VFTCEDQDGYLVWEVDTHDLSEAEREFLYLFTQFKSAQEEHPLLDTRLSYTNNSVAVLRLYIAEFNLRVAVKNSPLGLYEQNIIRYAAQSAAQNWEG